MTRIINTLKNYKYRYIDIKLVVFVLALTILGINVISSANDQGNYGKMQTIGANVGVVVM